MLTNISNGVNNFSLIPLVIATGLIDGLSPCVIAILIFFIAFLVSLQRTFKNILFLGLVYISVVFLVYLAVGVGLFSGIMLFGQHHFFAKLGSWFLILWGVVQVKDSFFPKSPVHPVRDSDKKWYKRFLWAISNGVHFRMPKVSSQKVKFWIEKATLLGVIVAAFLVGLCAVPCSAGIYTAVTSLLASKTTYWTGFFYLLLYNLMVILPLIILLLLAVNPFTLAKLAEWRKKNERAEKLVMGLMMIALGASILIFFV